MKFTVAKKAIALTGAVAMLGSVAACGSDTASGKPAQDKDVTEITVWAWEPTLTQVAKDFTKKTGIKVDLKNVGTNTKEYTQLDNAIEAGSGAPDVAQVEYYAIPQYAIKGNLLDITDKTSGYSDFYTPGPWASVQFAGKVYGLPMDSGPMAFFYNKEVFDKAGVDAEQIKTWDQYYDAAKKIHALGDNYYITSDTGDAGFFDSMTWLAGAKPFQTSSDGSEVTVNLTEDKGVKTFTDFWQKLLDEGLLDTKTAGWSEDWFKGMVDGTIASLFTGAWMPAKSLELQHTIRLIRELDAEIAETEEQIQSILDELHSPITTIPGLGFRMAAMILSEVGDFARFDSPDKLLAYAGMSPSTYQSGQLKNCYPHMEKRGSRYLRYALYNATKYVCQWEPGFSAYLAKKRAEGKHYNVAISHAAKKLVRLIFAMEKSGTPYHLTV